MIIRCGLLKDTPGFDKLLSCGQNTIYPLLTAVESPLCQFIQSVGPFIDRSQLAGLLSVAPPQPGACETQGMNGPGGCRWPKVAMTLRSDGHTIPKCQQVPSGCPKVSLVIELSHRFTTLNYSIPLLDSRTRVYYINTGTSLVTRSFFKVMTIYQTKTG